MTLREWLDTWMRLYVWPTDLAQNTKLCYDRAVRAVPPALGEIGLTSLTALDLRPWLLDVARATPRAAQLDRVMLSRALKVAAKLELCRPGIVDPDTLPKTPHRAKTPEILDRDQLTCYLAAVCAIEEPAALALAFCVCGLRRGEARGVTWQDIDLQTGILTVCGQRQGMGAKVPCKTAASVRRVELPEMVLGALRRASRGLPWVFVYSGSENSLYRLHGAILRQNGLPHVTLHGLRHSVATALVRGAHPVKDVQGLLGHAHYHVTADIYANHLPSVSDLCKRMFA